MIYFPHAKINLGLHIIDRRPDGFHNIETVFYPVQWQDALEINEYPRVRKSGIRFVQRGIRLPGDPNDNLCVKAFRLLEKDYKLPPLQLTLLKNIPAGAGLGGGSSDAAFTLRLLNDTFRLGLGKRQLQQYCRQLGSDCAFFIEKEPVFAYGKGDRFRKVELDLSGTHILLVHPGIHVSTADAYAYANKRGKTTGKKTLLHIINQPQSTWRKKLENDFEQSVFKAHPAIAVLKQFMYDSGAFYASMSGSGSAVFGLFRKAPHVPESLHKLKYWTGVL